MRWNTGTSRWRIFKEGLPQGSPLSPLLFLFTASLPGAITASSPGTTPTSFADDLTLENADTDPQRAATAIQAALGATETWCEVHHLKLAPEKTEALLVTVDPRQNNGECRPLLRLCGTDVTYVRELKILGVTIDSQLTMATQAKTAGERIRQRNRVISSISARSWGADTDTLRRVYTAFARPAGLYASGAWMPYISPTQEAQVQRADNEVARIITGLPAKTNTAVATREAGLEPVRLVAAHEAACNLLHYSRFDAGHPLRSLSEDVPIRIRRQGGARSSWRDTARKTLEAAGLANTVIEHLPTTDDTAPLGGPQRTSPSTRLRGHRGTPRQRSGEPRPYNIWRNSGSEERRTSRSGPTGPQWMASETGEEAPSSNDATPARIPPTSSSPSRRVGGPTPLPRKLPP